MPTNSYKVVAFDCDGVMFNTQKANDAYYNSILDFVKMPPMTSEQSAYAHMHTVEEALNHLISVPDIRKKAEKYRRKMTYLPFMKLMAIEPHLKQLLDKVRPAYSTAIATNRTDTIQRVLLNHGLTEDFDLVVSALDVKNPKPFPDQLLKILTHFGIKASQMLYIGDSKLDELAATAAKVSFVAFDNPELKADYHINSLKELEAILGL
jgi:phosphoglycolate phosphatase-like HAD superfamily hydrolase